jgi:hypothetical protein
MFTTDKNSNQSENQFVTPGEWVLLILENRTNGRTLKSVPDKVIFPFEMADQVEYRYGVYLSDNVKSLKLNFVKLVYEILINSPTLVRGIALIDDDRQLYALFRKITDIDELFEYISAGHGESFSAVVIEYSATELASAGDLYKVLSSLESLGFGGGRITQVFELPVGATGVIFTPSPYDTLL